MQRAFSSLAHSFATADSLLDEKRESMSRHETLQGELRTDAGGWVGVFFAGGKRRYQINDGVPPLKLSVVKTVQWFQSVQQLSKLPCQHSPVSKLIKGKTVKTVMAMVRARAAVSGRMRYLVETPEVMWGHLDTSQHLAAARRFRRAHVVRGQLKQRFPRDLLARFPLLSHQWPLVAKFK
jgi:hypothetical protein